MNFRNSCVRIPGVIVRVPRNLLLLHSIIMLAPVSRDQACRGVEPRWTGVASVLDFAGSTACYRENTRDEIWDNLFTIVGEIPLTIRDDTRLSPVISR